MTLLGADTDALDKDANAMTKSAEIVDDVCKACEAIVAASFFLGPFGASFIAYLEHTVIPWLKKVSESLKMLAKLLSFHADAQRQASDASSLTSGAQPALPSYVSSLTAGAVLTAATTPSMSAYVPPPSTPRSTAVTQESSWLGLVHTGKDANGNVVDRDIGFSTSWGSLLRHDHRDVDASGQTLASSTNYESRVGSVDSPWLDERSETSTDSVRDVHGAVVGTQTNTTSSADAFGLPIARSHTTDMHGRLIDGTGTISDTIDSSSSDYVLFGDHGAGATTPGAVPALVGRTNEDHYQPLELSWAQTHSTGPTIGNSDGNTFEAHFLGYDRSSLEDGGVLGVDGKISADYTSNEFHGTQNWLGHRTIGDLDIEDIGAGVGATGTAVWGAPDNNIAIQGGAGLGPGAAVGTWAIQHDDAIDIGGYVQGIKVNPGVRYHHEGR